MCAAFFNYRRYTYTIIFGFVVAALFVSSCCSCHFWVTCYGGIDERIQYMMKLGAEGQGRDKWVFDREDCRRPLRALCKLVILAFIVPCELFSVPVLVAFASFIL